MAPLLDDEEEAPPIDEDLDLGDRELGDDFFDEAIDEAEETVVEDDED
jgi:hypothetical protein